MVVRRDTPCDSFARCTSVRGSGSFHGPSPLVISPACDCARTKGSSSAWVRLAVQGCAAVRASQTARRPAPHLVQGRGAALVQDGTSGGGWQCGGRQCCV